MENRIEKYKFSTAKANEDGFIESIQSNVWFRNDSEYLFSATNKGFIKVGGSKNRLLKDDKGNILIKKKKQIETEQDVKAKLERNLSENGIMAYIIAKHQQEYLDAIHGLKKLMIPSEVAVMERLRKANLDFIVKTDKSLKKANLDISKIEELVMDMLDRIEVEFKKL